MKPICSICTESLFKPSGFASDPNPVEQDIPRLGSSKPLKYVPPTLKPTASLRNVFLNRIGLVIPNETEGAFEIPSKISKNIFMSSQRSPTAICTARCGHVFHFICLDKWWDKKQSRGLLHKKPKITTETKCPVCKKFMSKKKLIQLFLDDHPESPHQPRIHTGTQTELEAGKLKLERKSETSNASEAESLQAIHSVLVYEHDKLTAKHLVLKEKLAYVQTAMQSLIKSIPVSDDDIPAESDSGLSDSGGPQPKAKPKPKPKRTNHEVSTSDSESDDDDGEPSVKRSKKWLK